MVYLPYTSEVQSTRGKFGQEFEAGTEIEPQRSRDVAAYWLSHSAFLPTVDWSIPRQSFIKKILPSD